MDRVYSKHWHRLHQLKDLWLRPWNRNCSRPRVLVKRRLDRRPLEGEADCVDCAGLIVGSGFDDRSYVGVERGAPFASKAVGDLAIDRAGAPAPSLSRCGRREVAVLTKTKE